MIKRILKIIFLFMILIISINIMGIKVEASSISGNYEYEFINNGTEVKITKYMGDEEYLYLPNTIAGKKVTMIGSYAFEGNNTIKEVKFNSNLTRIDMGAFNNCSSLERLEIPSTIKTIDSGQFGSQYTFGDCENLKTVVIGNGLTYIPQNMFRNNVSLESVTIGNGVKTIGDSAFYGCTKLKTIKFGIGVKSIGDYAFYYCENLTSIVFPNNLQGIGDFAFNNCSGLRNVSFNGNLETIGRGAFNSCSSIEKIVIPDSVKTIDSGQFSNQYTFGDCENLKTVVIGNGLTYIPQNTFRNNVSLESVTIGNGVKTIGDYAFYGCAKLKKVYFLGNAPAINTSSFYNVNPSIVFYYKAGAIGFNDLNYNTQKFDSSNTHKTVTFNPNGGSGGDIKLFTLSGITVSMPKEPTRTGYTFAGWYLNSSGTGSAWDFNNNIVENNITLYAKWSLNKYTLKFDATGGICQTISKTVTYNSLIGNLPIPEKQGYTFIGWYPGVDGSGSMYTESTKMPARNMTLYAKWEKGIAAPSNLKAEKITATSIKVSWSSVSGATKYEVYRSTKYDTGYIKLGETTSTSYTSNNLTLGKTYYYKIKVAGGNTYSKIVNCPLPLSKPSYLGIEKPTPNSIKVSWRKVGNTIKYEIYRSTKYDTGYVKIGETTSTSYTSNNLAQGKTYYYKIKAIGSSVAASSEYSSIVKATLLLDKPTITVYSPESGAIKVSWSIVSGATKYEVYRSTKYDTGYVKVGETTGTSYTSKGLIIGNTYYYKIKAIASDTAANSTYSSISSCTLSQSNNTVTNLKVEKSTSTSIKASWSSVSGATKYEVYRSTKYDTGYVKVGETTNTSYTSNNLTPGKTYYYKIKVAGGNTYSKIVNCPLPLSKPSYLGIEKPTPNSIKVSWREVENTIKYEIYRSTKYDTGYVKIGETTSTSYTSNNLAQGKTYYYKIKAIGSSVAASSEYSSIVKATLPLNEPINIRIENLVSGSIKVSWSPVADAEKYEVYRSTTQNGQYSKVGETTNTNYTSKGLTIEKRYYYKVKAIASESIANSKYSGIVSIYLR